MNISDTVTPVSTLSDFLYCNKCRAELDPEDFELFIIHSENEQIALCDTCKKSFLEFKCLKKIELLKQFIKE